MRSAPLAVFFHLDATQAPTLAGFCSSLYLARLAPVHWPKLTYPTLSQFQTQTLGQVGYVGHLVNRLIDVIRVKALVLCDTGSGTCPAA